MKGTFTNLYGVDIGKMLGHPGGDQCQRTPESDSAEVNDQARLDLSVEGFKTLEKGAHGKNVNWATDINQELPIKIGSGGLSGNLKPETISKVFQRAAAQRGDNPALRVMRDNKEQVWTWRSYYGQALAFAKALEKVGVDERKAVNIMGFNSPEWAISFFGAVLHNNCVSGVYTTNGADACKYQAKHSGAQVIVVDTLEQLELYASVLDDLPALKALVAWGATKLPEKYRKDTRFYAFSDFLQLGKSVPDRRIEQLIDKQQPGQCAVLIYTSGTTGYPKGVMLSHDNLIFNASSLAVETVLVAPIEAQIPSYEHRIVSYLPLSHIAGLQFDLTNHLIFGCQVYFAKKDALQGTLVETLQWCRPTLFLAVPRIWEKFEDKLKAIAASKPAVLQNISGWAKGHGLQKVRA